MKIAWVVVENYRAIVALLSKMVRLLQSVWELQQHMRPGNVQPHLFSSIKQSLVSDVVPTIWCADSFDNHFSPYKTFHFRQNSFQRLAEESLDFYGSR